jgi:hypothetical protein
MKPSSIKSEPLPALAVVSGSAVARLYIHELLADVQEQIDELRPLCANENCKDAYEHGWRNGALYVWVELRRNLKEQLSEPNTNVQRRSGDEPASPSVLKPTDQPPTPERSL